MVSSEVNATVAERSFLLQSLLYFLEETCGNPNCHMRSRALDVIKSSPEVRTQLLDSLSSGRHVPTVLRNVGFGFARCFQEHQQTRKWMLECLSTDERPAVLLMLLAALRDMQFSDDMYPAMNRVYDYLNCSELESEDVSWDNCHIPSCVIHDDKFNELLRRYAYLVTRRYCCEA